MTWIKNIKNCTAMKKNTKPILSQYEVSELNTRTSKRSVMIPKTSSAKLVIRFVTQSNQLLQSFIIPLIKNEIDISAKKAIAPYIGGKKPVRDAFIEISNLKIRNQVKNTIVNHFHFRLSPAYTS